MTPGQQMIVTIITAVLASGGLWAVVQTAIVKHNESKSAIAIGVQCLLRDRIIQAERYYSEKGYCDPDDKTNIEHMFDAYQALGGNDVAHKAYEIIVNLPSYPPKGVVKK